MTRKEMKAEEARLADEADRRYIAEASSYHTHKRGECDHRSKFGGTTVWCPEIGWLK